MTARPRLRRLLSAAAGLVLAVAGLAALPAPAQAATSLPCDIYGTAGTPCVSANSTVRALYAAYNGPLYQIKRVSDGATTDVGLLTAGGYANAASNPPAAPPRTAPGCRSGTATAARRRSSR